MRSPHTRQRGRRGHAEPTSHRARLGLEHLEARDVPAAVGGLDPLFGTDGQVTTTFGGTDIARATALQPDGKIVVVGSTTAGGDFAIARYNPDGSLDDTFSEDGQLRVTFGGNDIANDVAIQPDGRIVVVGSSDVNGDLNFAIARVLADGSGLDTSFDGDGKRQVGFGGEDVGNAVALQDDGKIVVAGETSTSGDFAVARLLPNGKLDTTFSEDGRLRFTFGGNDDGNDVAIQPDGRIVVVGSTTAGGGISDFAIARVLADGSGLDPSFGGDGKVLIGFGDAEIANAVALQPDGKIVVVGETSVGDDFAVARLNPDGSLDATFNGNGLLRIDFGGNDDGNDVAIQPDGRIVVVGFNAVGGDNDFAVARVTADGKLDPSFDGDGKVTVDFGGIDSGAGVALDPNGRIVAIGSTSIGGDFAVARLIGSIAQSHQYAVGAGAGGSGQVNVYNADGSVAYSITPFPSAPGGVRVATADVTGDGVPDLIAGAGPGAAPQVRVYDGATQEVLWSMDAFESSFLGGVYVAAGDMTGDGKADVAITPDEGGGPRVRLFSGNGFTQIADFFGIDDPNFRGGARPALGDVNGDGIADLLVAAGFGGGPRLATFDGTSLAGGPVKLFGDFFVFEPALRNGVFVTAGDLDGDGFAEVIAGGGPGGGPRVFALSGADLLTGSQQEVANFFAGDVNNRGGVRLAVKDLDGDNQGDLVAGAGAGAGSRVTTYLGVNISSNGTPPASGDFDALPGFAGGVFVG